MAININHFWYFLGAIILLIAVIHLISALTRDRRIRYTETGYASSKITPELDGYVIALVTDTHELSPQKLRQITANMNTRQIDLLLLGGDYARGRGFWQTMEILGKTKTADGIYGVGGNHDNHLELYEAMQSYGIAPLDNQGLYIRPGFYLAGVADAWRRWSDVVNAVTGAEPVDFVLLLSHNPDIAMQQNTTGVDVMLCGHTHGGIMTFLAVGRQCCTLSQATATNLKAAGPWPLTIRWFLSAAAPACIKSAACRYCPAFSRRRKWFI